MSSRTQLSDRHSKAGARLHDVAGRDVPASFGDFDAEYSALSTGVAIMDRSHLGRVVASGSDALDLINRFSTNETVGLSDGDVVVTVLTSDIGRVLELITVIRHSATESILITNAGAEETVADWLDRYNFGEDCVFKISTDDSAQITISGPEAAGLGVPLPETGRVIDAEIGGVAVEILRASNPSLDSYEVLVDDTERAVDVWDALVAAGAIPVGEEPFNVFRVERGLPSPASELSDRVNPLEAGLQPYVSFTKGCYMGQEVIARLDTYDKLQRRLVGLVGPPDTGSGKGTHLSAGSSLRTGDRVVGQVTSAVTSPALGRAIALAYIRKGHAEPGTTLESDQGQVEVVALPFKAAAVGQVVAD